MDMMPTDFVDDCRGVMPKEELHILTPMRKGTISGVSEPKRQVIEMHRPIRGPVTQ